MQRGITAGTLTKMSTKQPIIKFSPFEALLIGEKNKILKPQPMKNAIFVTRLKKRSRAINLRDLFGLENDSKQTESSDVVFKMPQRVRDFLRTRRLKNNCIDSNTTKNRDSLCYEFEGKKMFVKNNHGMTTKYEKAKLKLNKVRLKKKIKFSENKRDLTGKFNNRVKKQKYSSDKYKKLPRIVLKELGNTRYSKNNYKLRGKNDKSTYKRSNEHFKSKKLITEQKNCLKNHIIHMKQLHCVKSETSNGICKKFKLNFKAFHFPVSTLDLKTVDFENDKYLTDIIYEHFPRIVKFESKNSFDFEIFLENSEILKSNETLNGKSKDIYFRKQNIRVIIDGRIPCIELNKISTSNYRYSSKEFIKTEYKNISSEANEAKSHLETGTTIKSLFFKNIKEKNVCIDNIVKPFVKSSWFENLLGSQLGE